MMRCLRRVITIMHAAPVAVALFFALTFALLRVGGIAPAEVAG